MKKDMQWKSYDPAWLVDLAEQQHPDKPWLQGALKSCTKAAKESRAYYFFIPADKWQWKTNLILEDKKMGTIVLDILEGERVGGVEFLRFV